MKLGGKAWKNFMAKLYGIGAAIVILGALFKIQHYPGASLMLTVGLGTEAMIFFFSAFEPLHEELDWTLVYPELATGEQNEAGRIDGKGSVTAQLDTMLSEAKIEPELIESLGNGLRTLSSQASNLSEITEASVATNDYVNSLSGAAVKMTELTDTYSQAATLIMGISESAEGGANAGEELSRMTNNLTELNKVYELQLESTRENMKATDDVMILKRIP
jgi:gliding motility-associated protein GldL